MVSETMDRSDVLTQTSAGPAPASGLILVFTAGKASAIPILLVDNEVELGRDHPAFAARPDARMSRRNAAVRFDGRRFVAMAQDVDVLLREQVMVV